jgi:hypothetical protein
MHVRVNDAATGQPTPVRIRFTNSAGEYFAPLGRLTKFATDDNEDVGGNLRHNLKQYAYIDGTCEIELPAGHIFVEIHKGPEYRRCDLHVMLLPGQLALRGTIERWIDLRGQRWYSGDVRAHSLTPHAALLEAAAEDLAVVNLLITMDFPARVCSWEGKAYRTATNILAFSGQRPALEMPGHMVVVNTHNVQTSLGSLGLLNCHRVVYPLIAADSEDWTLADWCDQCHRKGGLVIWTGPVAQAVPDAGSGYGERLADLMLGKIDALELDSLWPLNDFAEDHWYSFLNSGCRVPLVGASAKTCNADLLGGWRTYTRLQPGEEFTYRNWIEAARAGRLFITNGPILSFTVDGQDPGEVINLSSLDQPVHIVADVCSLVPIDTLELILNGEIYHQAQARGSPPAASFHLVTKVPTAGWLALRCSGPLAYPETSSPIRFGAHTSPIYIQVEGRPAQPNRKSLAALLDHLEKMLAWAAKQRHNRDTHANERLIEILESARRQMTKAGQT